MQIVQSQAYFARSTRGLGILAAESAFFEFDPNSAHHNVRAVVINFADGPDHLEMILQSIDNDVDLLWVSCVLNSSSNNFETPVPVATRALVETLVDSAPTLSQSPVLVDCDYRSRSFRGPPWAVAPVEATQTLLVFVTVGFGEGQAVVRVCRVRGANLVCGNENCGFFSCPALSPRVTCRLCHGLYICDGACNMAATADHHLAVCTAIRATHRAWLLHRRTPDEPDYLVPTALDEEEDLSEPDTPADDGSGGGSGGAAEAVAADAHPPAGLGAENGAGRLADTEPLTDDEAVDDTQPLEEVEVVFETPPGAATTATLRLLGN